jgi:hypothetical protein
MWFRLTALYYCFIAVSLIAQQPPPAKPSPALTVDGIISMVEAGISDEVIVARIRKEGKTFDLTPDDLIRLKKAKVSDAVMKAMIDPQAAPDGLVTAGSTERHPPAQAPPAARDSSSTRSRFRKLLDATKKKMDESMTAPGQGGPKAIDAAGLRNILPQYDPNRPLSEQFPHVAITVLKAPRMWADTYLTSTPGGTGLFTGCFTLKVVVWSDADHSKTAGPFDWCSPRDVQIKLGPAYLLSTKPGIKERMSGYLTGVNRTEGPRAPATLLPTDRETQELQKKNNHDGSVLDLNMDNATRLTLMFANVRHAMGQTLSDNGDFRVWIVKIVE